MKISYISPFCNLLKKFTSVSILDRAKQKGIVDYDFLDLFSFSDDLKNIEKNQLKMRNPIWFETTFIAMIV